MFGKGEIYWTKPLPPNVPLLRAQPETIALLQPAGRGGYLPAG